jgi:hypothetical protein
MSFAAHSRRITFAIGGLLALALVVYAARGHIHWLLKSEREVLINGETWKVSYPTVAIVRNNGVQLFDVVSSGSSWIYLNDESIAAFRQISEMSCAKNAQCTIPTDLQVPPPFHCIERKYFTSGAIVLDCVGAKIMLSFTYDDIDRRRLHAVALEVMSVASRSLRG